VRSRVMTWLIMPIAFAMVGCGDGIRRVHVEGVVKAKGTIVADATVSFLPMPGTIGEGGIGRTDASGKYTLISSRKDDPGISPGKYRVRLNRYIDRDGSLLPSDAKQADHPDMTDSVPSPYDGIGSPLELTIPDGGGKIDIEIPVSLISKKK
jgi:hypothetical protein